MKAKTMPRVGTVLRVKELQRLSTAKRLQAQLIAALAAGWPAEQLIVAQRQIAEVQG